MDVSLCGRVIFKFLCIKKKKNRYIYQSRELVPLITHMNTRFWVWILFSQRYQGDEELIRFPAFSGIWLDKIYSWQSNQHHTKCKWIMRSHSVSLTPWHISCCAVTFAAAAIFPCTSAVFRDWQVIPCTNDISPGWTHLSKEHRKQDCDDHLKVKLEN